MTAVVIVGPSKVGKTTLSRTASQLVGVDEYLDLDEAADTAAGGWPERGFEILRRAVWHPTDCVIDVGAGFQNDQRGSEELQAHRGRLIAVIAPADTIHARHPGRDREEFMFTEFREYRTRIYEMGTHVLTVSDDAEADQRGLARLISDVLGVDRFPDGASA